MAIPTNFINGTPVANTSKSFKIGNTGCYAIDDTGALSCYVMPLLGDACIVFKTQPTEAQVVAAMLAYVRRSGNPARGDAGQTFVQASGIAPAAASVCT